MAYKDSPVDMRDSTCFDVINIKRGPLPVIKSDHQIYDRLLSTAATDMFGAEEDPESQPPLLSQPPERSASWMARKVSFADYPVEEESYIDTSTATAGDEDVFVSHSSESWAQDAMDVIDRITMNAPSSSTAQSPSFLPSSSSTRTAAAAISNQQQEPRRGALSWTIESDTAGSANHNHPPWERTKLDPLMIAPAAADPDLLRVPTIEEKGPLPTILATLVGTGSRRELEPERELDLDPEELSFVTFLENYMATMDEQLAPEMPRTADCISRVLQEHVDGDLIRNSGGVGSSSGNSDGDSPTPQATTIVRMLQVILSHTQTSDIFEGFYDQVMVKHKQMLRSGKLSQQRTGANTRTSTSLSVVET